MNTDHLIPKPDFFTNYGFKMKSITNKINQFSCWKYQSLITQQKCDMNPFFDGLESIGNYVKKQFKFDTDTGLVHISDTETVSIHDIPNIPEDGCKQVVLGTFELIAVYFYYNEIIADKFILLSAENWTENLNQMYVSCAFKLLLHNQSCTYPIRILLPTDENILLRTNKTTQKKSPRATLFEMCIILQQSKRFEVYEYPLDNHSYHLYFMKYIPGTGGRRTQRNRRNRRTRKNRYR